MSRVILVDNSAEAFCFNPENGVLVESWFSDPEDTALLGLLRMLRELKAKGVGVEEFLGGRGQTDNKKEEEGSKQI